MSVSVNLLPREVVQRGVTKRRTIVTAAAVAAWTALLGGAWVVETNQVDAAAVRREEAQAVVVTLEADVAALAPYGELAADVEAGNLVLAFAMRDQIAWSRVLADLSTTFPTSSSLLSLTATARAQAASTDPPGAPPAAPADPHGPVADVQFAGYTTAAYAPGVRDVVLKLRATRGFEDPTVSTATREDREGTQVTSFNGAAGLGAAVLSHRYDAGLPAEVTP